jgi:hypothetical protein
MIYIYIYSGLGTKKPGSVGGYRKPRMFNKYLTATILAILVLGQGVVSVPQNLPCTSSSTSMYSSSLNPLTQAEKLMCALFVMPCSLQPDNEPVIGPALYDAFSFMVSGN